MHQRNGWLGVLRFLGAAVAAAGLLVVVGPAVAGDLKIGYVDLDKGLNECVAGKKAVEVLKKKKDTYEGQGKQMGEELNSLKESLEKQSLTLSDDARRQKEREIRDKERDLQTFIRDKQEEITEERNRKMQVILKDLKKIIRELGQAGDYTIVLEKAQLDEAAPTVLPPVILYAQGGDDLTAEVIARYDKLAASEKSDDASAARGAGGGASEEKKDDKGKKKNGK